VHLPWTVPREKILLDSTATAPEMAFSEAGTPAIVVAASAEQLEASLTASSNNDSHLPPDQRSDAEDEVDIPKRVLHMSHFEKALKEITPSASEQLGSLADLRKWNEEFGEGGKKRGKRIWGGKFGFILKPGESGEGRVQSLD